MAWRIGELFRCRGLHLFEIEECLQIGVAFQIAEHTLQNRRSVDKVSVTLIEPQQKLLFRILQFPSPGQTIIIDRLSRACCSATRLLLILSK